MRKPLIADGNDRLYNRVRNDISMLGNEEEGPMIRPRDDQKGAIG